MYKVTIFLQKAAILLAIALIIIVSGCKKEENIDKTKPVRVGAILPLTGFLASVGEDEKIGIELALAKINKNKRKIEVVYEDSMSSPKKALSAANKLITSGVEKIILSTTPTVLSVLEAYKNNNNLFFIAQCMTPNILEGYSNAIRIYATVDRETSLMAKYINDNKVEKIFMLHINNDFGKSSIAALIGKIHSKSVEIKQESFGFSEKKFDSLILKMKDFQPDIVVIYSYPAQWPSITKQMEEQNFDVPILANSGFGVNLDSHKGLNVVDNIIYAAPYYVFSEEDERIREFRAELKAKYNREPNFDIVYFFDTMNILASNILHSHDNELFKKEITSKKYRGISGTLEFDRSDIVVDMKLVKFINGQISPINK